MRPGVLARAGFVRYLASTPLPARGKLQPVLAYTDPLTTYEVLVYSASGGRCVTTSGACDGTPWSPGHAHPRLSHLSHLPAASMDQECARSTHI